MSNESPDLDRDALARMVKELQGERDDLQASLAWLVNAVIENHEIVATPNKEAWMSRAKECGKNWRRNLAEMQESAATWREMAESAEAQLAAARADVEWLTKTLADTEGIYEMAAEERGRYEDAFSVLDELSQPFSATVLDKAKTSTPLELLIEAVRELKQCSKWQAESLAAFRAKFGAQSNAEALDSIDRLRAALAQVGDKVKAEAVRVLEYQLQMATENEASDAVNDGLAEAVHVISSMNLAAIVAASAEMTGEPEPGTAAWHVARMGTWTFTPHPEGECDQAILTKRDGVYVCGQCGRVPNSSGEAAAEGQEAGDGKE